MDRIPILLATVWFLSSFSQPCAGQAPDQEEANRFTKAGDIAQGKANVRIICGRCHGPEGGGGKGPSLIAGKFRRARTDQDLLRIIRDGIPGTGMPGFGPDYEDAYWPVIAYLRAAGARTKPPPGMLGIAAEGRELFQTHHCGACHHTHQEQGGRGPDLTRSTSSMEHVRTALLDPNSQIDESYRSVTLQLREGRVLAGRRLDEDSFHLLVLDEKGRLHSVPKETIEEFSRPTVSLMPDYSKALSEQDVKDLIAYIFSLREETQP